MSIRWYKSYRQDGEPDVDYYRVGNGFTYLSGDVLGMLSGTSAQSDASPAGTLRRLGASVGGTATAFPIIVASGIWGVAWNDATTDDNGNIITPSVPSTIDPSVPAILPLPAYDLRHPAAAPVAGVRRGQMGIWKATGVNVFIQRHKAGTRVNQLLVGKPANLTYNATTDEFEVDTTGASNKNVVVITEVPPLYDDNITYYDSASYATDAVAGWVAFTFLPAVQGPVQGLMYSS